MGKKFKETSYLTFTRVNNIFLHKSNCTESGIIFDQPRAFSKKSSNHRSRRDHLHLLFTLQKFRGNLVWPKNAHFNQSNLNKFYGCWPWFHLRLRGGKVKFYFNGLVKWHETSCVKKIDFEYCCFLFWNLTWSSIHEVFKGYKSMIPKKYFFQFEILKTGCFLKLYNIYSNIIR